MYLTLKVYLLKLGEKIITGCQDEFDKENRKNIRYIFFRHVSDYCSPDLYDGKKIILI